MLDPRSVNQLRDIPTRDFPANREGQGRPKHLMDIGNSLRRETRSEPAIEHALNVLRRQLVDLDSSESRNQVLFDIDLVAGIGKRSNSRSHCAFEPGSKKLVKPRRPLLIGEVFAKLNLRRAQPLNDLMPGPAIDVLSACPCECLGAPQAVGFPTVDTADAI